jgi:hypothetical protein
MTVTCPTASRRQSGGPPRVINSDAARWLGSGGWFLAVIIFGVLINALGKGM